MRNLLLLIIIVACATSTVRAQFRLASDGFVSQVSNPNDSTYIVDVNLFADLTGSGYTATGIIVGYRLFSQRGQLYEVNAIANATFGSARLTLIEKDNNLVDTEGLPIGQVQVYDPGASEAIPQVPFGTTGAASVLQAAVVSYNSRIVSTGGGVSEAQVQSIVADSAATLRAMDIATITYFNNYIDTLSRYKRIYFAGFGQSNMGPGGNANGDVSQDGRIKILRAGGVVSNAQTVLFDGNNSPVWQAAKAHIRGHPTDTVFIVYVAQGGTSISSWGLGEALRTEAEAILASHGNPKLDGIFWLQGEKDRDNSGINELLTSSAADQNYISYFNTIVKPWLRSISSESTPIVLGEVGDTPYALYRGIGRNKAINAIGSDDDPYTLVSKGASLFMFDSLHFDGTAIDTIGQRMYDAWKSAPYYVPGQTTDPPTALELGNKFCNVIAHFTAAQGYHPEGANYNGRLISENPAGSDEFWFKLVAERSGNLQIDSFLVSTIVDLSILGDVSETGNFYASYEYYCTDNAGTRGGIAWNIHRLDEGGAAFSLLNMNGSLRMYRYTPTSSTLIGIVGTISENTKHSVSIESDTHIRVWLDGTLVISYEVPIAERYAVGQWGLMGGISGFKESNNFNRITQYEYCAEKVSTTTNTLLTTQNKAALLYDENYIVSSGDSVSSIIVDGITYTQANVLLQPQLTSAGLLFDGNDRMPWEADIFDRLDSWALILLFKTGSDVTSQQAVLTSTLSTTNRFGVSVRNGQIQVGKYDGDFSDRLGATALPNTWYQVRISNSNAVSVDGAVYVSINGISDLIVPTDNPITTTTIGTSFGATNDDTNGFTGTVAAAVHYEGSQPFNLLEGIDLLGDLSRAKVGTMGLSDVLNQDNSAGGNPVTNVGVPINLTDAARVQEVTGVETISEDSDVVLSVSAIKQNVTLVTTTSATDATSAILPPANASRSGYTVSVLSISGPGATIDNTLSTTTADIRDGSSDISLIVIPYNETYSVICRPVNNSGTYRWVLYRNN